MEPILHFESIDLAEYVRLQLHIQDISMLLFLRATLLLAGGILIIRMMRRFNAEFRHALWTVVFVMLLALPVVMLSGLTWHIPVLPPPSYTTPSYTEIILDESLVQEERAGNQYVEVKPYTVTPGYAKAPVVPDMLRVQPVLFERRPFNIILLIWAIGFLASLVSIGVGKVRWNVLVRRAEPLLDPDWHDKLESLREQLGINRDVRLLMSNRITTPMTGGSLFPVILVPDSALTWSARRMHLVLAHELVHIKRYDALRAFTAKLALGIYWFHPLSWIASRMATISMEEACDEGVLNLGTKPSSYAQELLNMADKMASEPSYAYLPMIRRSQLEQRLLAILDPCRPVKNATMNLFVLVGVLLFGIVAVVAHPVSSEDSPEITVTGALPEEVIILEGTAVDSVLASEPLLVVTTGEPTEGESVEPTIVAGSELLALVPDTSEDVKKAKPAPVAPLSSRPEVSIDLDDFICEVPFGSGKAMKFNFYGSLTTLSDDDGKKYEYSGEYNSDKVEQIHRDGVRLCMRVHGNITIDDNGLIKVWSDDNAGIKSDKWMLLEAEDDKLHKYLLVMKDGDFSIHWTIDGEEQEIGEESKAWLTQMVDIFQIHTEIGKLNDKVGTYRERLEKYHEEMQAMYAEIAAHKEYVRNLGGELADLRHQGEVIGYVPSSPERQAEMLRRLEAMELEMRSLAAADSEEAKKIAERIELQKRELEEQIAAQKNGFNENIKNRMAEVEAKIADYNLDGKVNDIEKKIDAFKYEERIAKIEGEIKALNVNGKKAELEKKIDAQVKELKRQMRRF